MCGNISKKLSLFDILILKLSDLSYNYRVLGTISPVSVIRLGTKEILVCLCL